MEICSRLAGLRWSKIASRLPGRTDNEIKKHWNTHIKKKLLKVGIDRVTHEPLNKQVASQDSSSSPALHLPLLGNNHKVKETDEVSTQENSSSSPAKNSSGKESFLLCSICSDDSLLKSLWLDETPMVDALWDSTPKVENTNVEMGMLPSIFVQVTDAISSSVEREVGGKAAAIHSESRQCGSFCAYFIKT